MSDREEISIALSKEIYKRTNRGLNKDVLDWYSRIESASFFNVTSATSLKYGGYGIIGHSGHGPCGTMSRTLLNALWRLDILARKLQLLNNAQGKGGGHTMIEFYHNGRWRVLSPSDNTFIWRTSNGDIAAAKEIQGDFEIFSQIYAVRPDYPYLFDNYKNIRWEKLPTSIANLIKFCMGEKRYNIAQTPKLYDQPRTLCLYCSILLSVLFGVLVYILRRKRKEQNILHATDRADGVAN